MKPPKRPAKDPDELYNDNLALLKRLEEKEQQLAEARKLVRFWAHQHTLNMRLLKQLSQTTSPQDQLAAPHPEP